MSRFQLSIGDVVARTGVSEPTLRMWERRYGFPEPERTPSGHRRYSEEQVELVGRVLALRESGLSMPAAIARSHEPADPSSLSLFSSLMQLRPDLQSRTVLKPLLIALSHAIEDEAMARADSRLMVGCFQRESFYRSSQARWRELAATTQLAAVIADFAVAAQPAGRPCELPIGRHRQLAREWALLVWGGRSSIVMVAREVASSSVDAVTARRSFELLWTVEPEAVRALGRVCVSVLAGALPQVAARAYDALDADLPMSPAEQVDLTTAVVNRTLSRIG